jgi:glyoxylase-like metal-dependent hydrolase (beta-lactamase superfamily II)
MKIHLIRLGFDRCFVIEDDGVVAIDAGVPDRVGAFARGLERASLKPEQVSLVIPTHGHWDHIGSARDIRELTGADIVMHEAEAPWLEQGLTPLPPPVTRWGRVIHAVISWVLPRITVNCSPVDVVLDDDDFSLAPFGVAGTVLHTPGHSPGSVSVLLEGGEVFVGDLAMNAIPLRLRPGLPILAEDMAAVRRSWRRLLRRGARIVYPAHGRPFPVSVIERELESGATTGAHE